MKSIGERILAQLSSRLPDALKEKMRKRFGEDHTSSRMFVNHDGSFNRLDDLDSPSGSMDAAEDFIKDKAGNDWQHLKPYVKWIFARYANKGIRRWEDVASRTMPALLEYDKLKRKKKLEANEKDINRFKSLSDLESLVEKYRKEDTSSGSERDKALEQGFYARGEAVLIHDDSKAKIVQLKSKRASCFFGRSTRWCTAARHDNEFDSYNRDNDLYIVDPKGSNKKYQLSLPKDAPQWDNSDTEFLDEKDMPFDEKSMYKAIGEKASMSLFDDVLMPTTKMEQVSDALTGFIKFGMPGDMMTEGMRDKLYDMHKDSDDLLELFVLQAQGADEKQEVLDHFRKKYGKRKPIYLDFFKATHVNLVLRGLKINRFDGKCERCEFVSCSFGAPFPSAENTLANCVMLNCDMKQPMYGGGVFQGSFRMENTKIGDPSDDDSVSSIDFKGIPGHVVLDGSTFSDILFISSKKHPPRFLSAKGTKFTACLLRHGGRMDPKTVLLGDKRGWASKKYEIFFNPSDGDTMGMRMRIRDNMRKFFRGTRIEMLPDDVLLVRKDLAV